MDHSRASLLPKVNFSVLRSRDMAFLCIDKPACTRRGSLFYTNYLYKLEPTPDRPLRSTPCKVGMMHAGRGRNLVVAQSTPRRALRCGCPNNTREELLLRLASPGLQGPLVAVEGGTTGEDKACPPPPPRVALGNVRHTDTTG